LKLSSAKKILIIRLSSLGDILLSTPLIRSVKKQYPDIKIDFLLREEYKDTLLLNPNISNLICFTNNRTDEIKKKIRTEKYDIIIDLQNNLRTAGLLEYSGAPKVKYKKKNIVKFLLVKFKLNLMKNSEPVPVRYAERIKELQLDDKGLELFTNKEPSQLINDDDKYIGFAPGARHFTKKWLSEYFIELGNKLASDGYKILLFGGKDDMEICRLISNAVQGSVSLANNNDLLQISADIKRCEAVVCNDSGMMHTAAASGVPVLAIFGSTVKEFGFTPYKIKHRVNEHLSLPCRPCTHIGRKNCPEDHFKCMKEITPEAVYQNVISLISE
jgi:lipopolysaccharide heptosyltransferase II